MEKKKWMTPILIIMVREAAFQSILVGCKRATSGFFGPNHDACSLFITAAYSCVNGKPGNPQTPPGPCPADAPVIPGHLEYWCAQGSSGVSGQMCRCNADSLS